VPLRVLTGDDVRANLSMADCVAAMEDVLAALARGELYQPLRGVYAPPGEGKFMGLMPAYRAGAAPLWALKAIVIHPDNPRRGLDAHQGAVLLNDGDTGQLRAVVDGSAITEIRTAAVSAVATRALARPDARTLAVLGSGVQARSHVEAMAVVLDLDRVRIAARDEGRTRAFADEMAARHGVPVEVAATPAGAVRDADVVVTATTSREPLVDGADLAPGTHVNAVGSSIPSTRELSGAAVAASTMFVDRRESTVNEAGDYLLALQEGAIGEDHIRAELGEVLAGMAAGRRSAAEITLFKSLGLAVEDLAAAELAVANAEAAGAGTVVDW
jgi:ornithine cyclodeaminase/alanine dehydrogenase-like protein (mu-crystallin family)